MDFHSRYILNVSGSQAAWRPSRKKAGWIQLDWNNPNTPDVHFTRNGRPRAGIVAVTGVIIQMHPEQIHELEQAAIALASALSAEGISAHAEGGLGVPNSNSAALHILVGSKPH